MQLPNGGDLASQLEPYDPSKHLKLEFPGHESQKIIPIPFTLFPKKIPEILRKGLTAVRHEEIRFPGEMSTTLFAAYPIYAPFYLVNFLDAKDEAKSRSVCAFRCLTFGV